MHDLESKLQTEFHHVPSVHSSADPLFDLEYADDVVLFARSRKVAQFLLNNIQTLAEESGMQLNKNKTALVLMNPQFANKELEVVEQYLHVTNLPASTTEQDVKQMFPSNTVTDIELYLMNPKPGCVRTTVQQAAVRWNSTEPIESQYKTMIFRRKTIKIAPMLAYQLHYGNGRPVPAPSNTIYLGAKVDDRGVQRFNLQTRLTLCNKQFREMSALWGNPTLELAFKVKVFKTIFHPKLLYGLYHSCLTESSIKVMDAWYMKSLRRVAGIKPAFINHVSNAKVYAKTRTVPISQLWKQRAMKYYGHVLRHPTDTISTVCFCAELIPRHLYTNASNRMGRPKQHWLPQISKLTEEVVHKDNNISKLPQPVPTKHSIKQIRNIANDRALWKKLLMPTHIVTTTSSNLFFKPEGTDELLAE